MTLGDKNVIKENTKGVSLKMEEIGRDFLEEYGLEGLSSIIAAAIIKAEEADPREKKVLFKAAIKEVCRIAIEAGVDPVDLCEASMTILEISNHEIARLRRELQDKKRAQQASEEAQIEKELSDEGY